MTPQSLTPTQKSAPAQKCLIVTPANADLALNAKALYVFVAGNLEFIPAGNTDSEIIGPYAVFAGQVIPFEVRQVRTGTTAVVGAAIG